MGHKLSIIQLPPSLDKPHVIRGYVKNGRVFEHETFVRNGTSTHVATKYDLDLMYYDRKNIIPDFEIHCHCPESKLEVFAKQGGNIYLRGPFMIENTGRRPIVIRSMHISLTWSLVGNDRLETYDMEHSSNNLSIIESGQIREFAVSFRATTNYQFGVHDDGLRGFNKRLLEERENMTFSHLEIVLTNGAHLTTELQIVKR
jgi:hypothetical protein